MDNNEWYYSNKSGSQIGPLSALELQRLIKEGEVSRTSMVWKKGMDTWMLLSQVKELNKPNNPTAAITPPPTANDNSPYLSTSTSSQNGGTLVHHYGGIGRLAYLLLTITAGILPFVAILTSPILESSLGENAYIVIGVLLIVSYIFIFWLIIARLKNIGMNPWLSLLSLVPIANIYIGYKCLACQTGYEETRVLDTAGKVIKWLYILFLMFIFALTLIAILFIGATAYKEGVERAQRVLDESKEGARDYPGISPAPSQ